jgi:hypothetical protein
MGRSFVAGDYTAAAFGLACALALHKHLYPACEHNDFSLLTRNNI